MEYGQYCRIKNTTIFGQYMGQVDGDNRRVYFYDEEIGKIKVVFRNKLEPVEKW